MSKSGQVMLYGTAYYIEPKLYTPVPAPGVLPLSNEEAADQAASVALASHEEPVATIKIRCRKDYGPISGQSITDRMVAICGCQGQYDCECVSIENQARRELWTEHNLQLKATQENNYDRNN